MSEKEPNFLREIMQVFIPSTHKFYELNEFEDGSFQITEQTIDEKIVTIEEADLVDFYGGKTINSYESKEEAVEQFKELTFSQI